MAARARLFGEHSMSHFHTRTHTCACSHAHAHFSPAISRSNCIIACVIAVLWRSAVREGSIKIGSGLGKTGSGEMNKEEEGDKRRVRGGRAKG